MKEAKFTDDNGQQFKPARVEDVTEVCFKCKRSLDMKSDLDIRHDKDMGEKRLRKKDMEGLPQAFLSNEDGNGENTLYCFRPEEVLADASVGPVRGFDIEVCRRIRLATQQLVPENQMYDSQAQTIFKQACSDALTQSGLSQVLNAAVGSLPTYKEFLNEFNTEAGGEDGDEQQNDLPTSQQSLDGGVVAGIAAPPALLDSPAPQKRCWRPSPQPAGQKPLDNCDGMSTIDGSTAFGDDEEDKGLEGNELLNVWKKRLPHAEVMDDSVDGRTRSGLKKRIKRLSKNERTQPDAAILTTYDEGLTVAARLNHDHSL